MRKLLVVALVLVPVMVLAVGKVERPPVSKWAEAPTFSQGGYPPTASNQLFDTVRIDTLISYIRYLFEQKQAIILPQDGTNHFFFAYNDAAEHVRTVVFDEGQWDPMDWTVTDIWEQNVGGQLRYICPTAHWDDAFDAWFPEVCVNVWPGSGGSATEDLTYWFLDEGGWGVGLWTPPIDVGGAEGTPDFYLPLVEAGPNNLIYLDGQTRAFEDWDDWHVFKTFDGWTGTEVTTTQAIFDSVPASQGYENTQMLYSDGTIVLATGGYMTTAYTDPTNPLMIAYRCSMDDGVTWGDLVWVDQTLVPDMPGTYPGIDGHYSNSFFDGVIDQDGDLHFACAIVDSGAFENTSYVHGIFDVHQDNGTWTASMITDGTYYINADSTWTPRISHGIYTAPYEDGDSWMHSPSLALHPDGYICAAWADIGSVNPADSTWWLEVWYSWSTDGNSWKNPVKVTETMDTDEYFPRLVPTTTATDAYVLAMVDGVDSPLDMIKVPFMTTGADDPAAVRPAVSSLTAKPNPFTEDVAVSFSLTVPGMVDAGIYNARGELVEDLLKGQMRAGTHSLVWSSGDAAPGVYFARVNVGEETLSTRMVLVK
jgi:hypothetical protein